MMPQLHGFQVFPQADLPVEALWEDPENVNEHSEIDLTATRRSLEKFGQVETLVVHKSTNKVIGGNGRLRIMAALGWKTAKCIPVEGSEDQLKTLAITLNKTGKNSDFNYEKLVIQLQDLQEEPELLELTGFQTHELEPLLSAEFHLSAGENEDIAAAIEEEKAPKKKSNLDARGITLQFSVTQKEIVDKAILEIREIKGDFSVEPSDCVVEALTKFLELWNGNET